MGARFVLRIGGSLVALAPGQIVIGRGDDCDVIVEDDLASRRHAVLHVGDLHVDVEDAGSRNGVLVDGARIAARTALSHGAVIGIGNARIVLERRRELRGPQVTPAKPIARHASQVGKQVSSIQGTLVGVSLAALVFRARAAIHAGAADEIVDAANKLAEQLRPGLAADRELVDEAVRAFSNCALDLARRSPTSDAWLDALFGLHARLERVLEDDVLRGLAEAHAAGARASIAGPANYVRAIRSRTAKLMPDEEARMTRFETLAKQLAR